MRKNWEMAYPDSCLNKARDDEMLFVLLGRDLAAPAAIYEWVRKRIELGLNTRDDEQIKNALRCAHEMQHDQLSERK